MGNEVERGPNPGSLEGPQGDTHPEVYAQAYHDVYHFIKQRDRTAQVSPSALVEVTPARLQYLDIVWNTYRSMYGHDMPVDLWTMHLYVLSEAHANGQPNDVASIPLGVDPALAIARQRGQPG